MNPRSFFIMYRPSEEHRMQVDVAFEESVQEVISRRGWDPQYIELEESEYPYLGVYRGLFFNRISGGNV